MKDDKTNEYLPDLPGLECVKPRDFQTLPLLIYICGFAIWQIAILVLSYITYKDFIEEAFRIPIHIIMGLGAYIFFRVMTAFLAYETDSKSLIMRGLLRTKRLLWEETKSASYIKKFYGTKILTLTTNNGTFKIDPRGIGGSITSGDLVVASIWQHLRRLDRANSIELPQSVISLWEDVSNSVPMEMDWGKSPTRNTKFRSAIAAAFFPILGLAGFFLFNDNIIMLMLYAFLLILFISMGLLIIAPSALHTAHKVRVKREGLEVELTFKTLFIAWSEVTSANWESTQQTSTLNIRSSNPKAEVKINYYPGNEESENLLLGIIRHLRSSSAQIAIPLPSIRTASDGKLKSCSIESSASLRRAYLATLPNAVGKKLQWLYVLPIVPFFAGLAGLLCLLFFDPVGDLSKIMYSGTNTRYLFPCVCWPFYVSCFACALLLGFVVERFALYLAGEHRSQFVEYSSLGSGRKSNRIIIRVLAVIAILGIAVTPIYIGCYMKITDKGIAVNRLLGLHERHYNWSKISSVKVQKSIVIDHGQSCARESYYINFSDGSNWKLDKRDHVRISNEQIRAAVEYVAKKANKPVKTVWEE